MADLQKLAEELSSLTVATKSKDKGLGYIIGINKGFYGIRVKWVKK